MFINELAEPQLLVIYPGRFQPFHKGHFWVYQYLVSKFGRNNVYIVTSNKVEPPKSPFPFSEKSYFMQLTGVPADRIVQASQPYSIKSIIDTGRLQVSDPANTVAIFAVSEKDMAEDPRFSFSPKKDGSPSYLQPFSGTSEHATFDKHGYVVTVPTFDFKVLGKPVRSATEIRAMYQQGDNETRMKLVTELYGKFSQQIFDLMNEKLGAANGG